ncbi:unnamed protein product [Durusdinium trenchii]|uniref:Uncharacterized protein n=1 Tax=Durusdinium trenchii TaxID=1381693 RepID=A0ABP0HYZ3_9DINO
MDHELPLKLFLKEEVARNVLPLELQPGGLPLTLNQRLQLAVALELSAEQLLLPHQGDLCKIVLGDLRAEPREDRVRWFKLTAKHVPFKNFLQVQGVAHAG